MTVPGSSGVSPRRILSTGLGEWVVEADASARTLAVGSGYASSLLYSFQTPGDVYWYMGSAGRFVTSTCYRNEYPEWVGQFNRETLPPVMRSSARWECSVPLEHRHLARDDRAAFEADGAHTTFPHRQETELPAETPDDPPALQRWLAWTPFLDGATLLLARRGVVALSLGQRASTDYLAIVLSQVDNAGHYYGPLSLETLDVLIRLDKELGDFFDFLDETVGSHRYLVAVSSDHGFPNAPEYLQASGEPGRRIREEEINLLLNEVSALTDRADPDSHDLATRVAVAAEQYDFVAEAYTPGELTGTAPLSDDYLRLYRNSHREDRIPRLPLFSLTTFASPIARAGVMLRLQEGAMIDLDVVIHGWPYRYDRHVPMIFIGP